MQLPLIFRLAKQSSYLSDHKYQVGTAILYKKNCLSYGRNHRTKTHPIMKRFDPNKTIHAELDAILGFKNKKMLKDCIMVVYRQDKLGQPALAKPCKVCQQILKFFNIKQVAYTTDGGYCIEQL